MLGLRELISSVPKTINLKQNKMKELLIMAAATVFVMSCRKSNELVKETDTLEVQEKNMSLITKFTGTGCSPCGSSGYTKFENFKEEYKGKATFLAFRSGVSMPDYFQAKKAISEQFGLRTSTPSFSYNFVQDNSTKIKDHNNSSVVANSNYKLSISGDNLNLKTTTQFFQNASGEFYLLPYIVVNGIVGYQNNHPDSPNTKLDQNVAGIAKPTSVSELNYLGYLIGTGNVLKGYKVNLDFDFKINPSWDQDNIEIVLVVLKKEHCTYSFVNSFSK